MKSQVPGKPYITYFSSFVLIFAILLFSILLGWIYFSTTRAIQEQQRVTIDLNNRNSARVLDGKKEQLQETLSQVAARYMWLVSPSNEAPQVILTGIVNRDEGHFRLDMLRFISADRCSQAIADSPFFDFQGLDIILSGSHEHHFGNVRLLEVGKGKKKLWLLARGKRLVDPRSGKVLGVLFGGVVLNNNVPLCRKMLKRSSGEYVSLAAGNSIISSSSPLPESILKAVNTNSLSPGTISVKKTSTEMWQVNISLYDKTDGIPLYTILVSRDTLQTRLRQTLLYSGGFVVLMTIGLFFLFGHFFSGRTRQAMSNLLDFTRSAVKNDEHSSYTPGLFREFNQIGMAVETMLVSLDEAAEKLVDAKEKAEGASHAKSVFLASMSHELRTPLNAILGYAQLMENDMTLTKKQRANIRIMYQSGDHLLSLINDILDLSKIEAGKIELVEKEFAPAPFFDGIVDIIRVRSQEKGLEFLYEIPDVLPALIVADELRLRQIVLNLLANAVKFTEEGYCSLQIETSTLSEEKTRLKISVADTGPGISSSMQKKVFDPFQQSGERLKYSEGAGLGLAISRKLITEMGGKIDLVSPVRENPPEGEGVGSCFSFTLDLQSRGRELVSGKNSNTVTGYRRISQKKKGAVKVLIVDDRLSNRQILRDILEPLGFVTEEAGDGCEVLAMCAGFYPDLILMDLQMPDIDGVEATRLLKASKDFATVPVVAITAAVAADLQLIKQLQDEANFCDFIYKPFLVEQLLKCLAKHLHLDLIRTGSVKENKQLAGFVAPPAASLEKIKQLVEHGNINELEKAAQEMLQIESGKYRVFAEALAELVENIHLAGIEKLLEKAAGS